MKLYRSRKQPILVEAPTYIGSPADQYRMISLMSASTQRNKGVCSGFSLFVRLLFPPSMSLPLSEASFFPHESAPLSPENEKFFTPCKLLAYGEMNATQRAVLRNILREDLVCI